MILQVSSAFAETFSDHVLIGGVSGRHYYITTATDSKYISPINNAMADWKSATGNLVSFTRTFDTDEVPAQAIIRAKSYPNYPYTKVTGYTELYNKKISIDKISPKSYDWEYAQIHLNTYVIKGFPADFIKGVVAHEMGHALGLSENN